MKLKLEDALRRQSKHGEYSGKSKNEGGRKRKRVWEYRREIRAQGMNTKRIRRWALYASSRLGIKT